MSSNYALEMHDISKKFQGVHALDKVSFAALDSKVNILIGENGAGKSTLMKILVGAIQKDSGIIRINGKEVDITQPTDAINLGVGMIYQELNLIQDMTVAENIFLGREPTSMGLVDGQKLVKEAKQLLDYLKIDIDPKVRVGTLSVAKQQMIEIAKAISLQARILVMDEPTSSLTEHEVKQLFEIIRKLNSEGVTIIYISHRMEEIYEIGDYITVMRDGKLVGDWPIAELSVQQLISHMVGREINLVFPKKEVEIGEEILKVVNLTKRGKFKNVCFNLRRGEILGFSGLVGAGRTEIANAIFGSDVADSGEIWVSGKKVQIKSPVDAINLKIGFVPEDRKKLGVNLMDTIARNICITIIDDISTFGFIDFKRKQKVCTRMVEKLSIKTPSLQQLVGNLSGGNQQKVVIAKWIAREVDILILDEPTRGVDVGSKSEIHKLIVELAQHGVGIILISSELPEVMGMSDRLIILHEGSVKGVLNAQETTQEKVMAYATNSKERMAI